MSRPDRRSGAPLYRWPAAAHFGRVVPKTKFYEHGTVTSAVRDKFVADVKRITWSYKLAAATINLPGTSTVPEIQVVTIDVKTDDVDDVVLATLDRAVQFPVLFEIACGEGASARIRMAAGPPRTAGATSRGRTGYLSTDWRPADAPRVNLPTAIDLSGLYAALLTPLLPMPARPGEPLSEVADRIERARRLDREIAALERRLRSEPQLNRKIELRRELRERTAARGALRA